MVYVLLVWSFMVLWYLSTVPRKVRTWLIVRRMAKRVYDAQPLGYQGDDEKNGQVR